MKIIDAHSHIDYITHNFQSDVCGTICCTTNEDEWARLIEIMKSDNRVYGCFGVHPWFISEIQNGYEKRLERLLLTDSNYMVGELGLDKYKPDMDKQIDVFITQLEIAIKLNRPVFIHCVGAYDKLFHILNKYKKLPIIVIHGFTANDDITQKLLQYENIYFSFGKNALYGGFCRIEKIPCDKILVESDADKDVVLKNIIDNISSVKDEIYMADIIYNNTIRVLNNE